jgi:Tfp pilus assembly protein PilF
MRIAGLDCVPELAQASSWLSGSLAAVSQEHGREAVRQFRALVESGNPAAVQRLLARAVELGDDALVADVLATATNVGIADRLALRALAGLPVTEPEAAWEEDDDKGGLRPVVSAALAVSPGNDAARVHFVCGNSQSRAEVRLGRLLGCVGTPQAIEAALTTLGDTSSGSIRGVALELAVDARRYVDVSHAIQAWRVLGGPPEERATAALAAGIVAERAGERTRAVEAFREALAADGTCKAALRAIASLESIDLAAALHAMADEWGDGLRGALARLEAIARSDSSAAPAAQQAMLDRAYAAAPSLPIAEFLSERLARRGGRLDEALQWLRRRRETAGDPVEAAIDAIREALLVADTEPALAAERLLEAHLARPQDFALRDLYERMSAQPSDDRGSWREQRAAEASGDTRLVLALEAASEYERAGDDEGAQRCAALVASADSRLAGIVLERIELRSGRVERLADQLLASARDAHDVASRREAYERLALLDATARHDAASALLWHRSILEETPDHKPSLRHVEHQLIGEGRGEELEPIATAIARSLRGTGAGEATAHAELAARLRIRSDPGSTELAADMVDLAADEPQASLWALRTKLSQARASGDDAGFVQVCKRIVDQASRPAEMALMLIEASSAASRLGQLADARTFLERAASLDPADPSVWSALFAARLRAGDPYGAAEAAESVARCSAVPEHQFAAWMEAARLWAGDANDEAHAIAALEAAAHLQPDNDEISEMLIRLYSGRNMQSELAQQLARRVERVTDPDQRLAIEVRRGRILVEVGDTAGARRAFEDALAHRPDDPDALSALADLCVALRDWEAAEQALVRLSRLLPTAEQQREVYARLGALYSRHLVNLSRAEVAFKEVLKRSPEDMDTARKLVAIYRRQNDAVQAIELQHDVVQGSTKPDERCLALLELAELQEQLAKDVRRTEKTLDAARREFPYDLRPLRALAEFYVRHQQAPAVKILLDRAAADARRALGAGRLDAEAFGLTAEVFELRGMRQASVNARAIQAAVEGRAAEVSGAGERAFDPQLDDLLAPESFPLALRSLLVKTGHAIESAAPIDRGELRLTPLASSAKLARWAAKLGAGGGGPAIEVFTSPKLGRMCLPVTSTPPVIALGEVLANDERVGLFLLLRAIKVVRSRTVALVRLPPPDVTLLLAAWLKCLAPAWDPRGAPRAALDAARTRIQAALPKGDDPSMSALALEAAGGLEGKQATLGEDALRWANRVALLAQGGPLAALDAIAVATGRPEGAPAESSERAAWIARASQARDLATFAVSDGFAQARVRCGLER